MTSAPQLSAAPHKSAHIECAAGWTPILRRLSHLMRESEGKSAGKLSSSVGVASAHRWNAAPCVQFAAWRSTPRDMHVVRRRSVLYAPERRWCRRLLLCQKVALCSCDKRAVMRHIDRFAAPRGGDTREAHACKFSRAPGPGRRRYDARKNVHIGPVDICPTLFALRQNPLRDNRPLPVLLVPRPCPSPRSPTIAVGR